MLIQKFEEQVKKTPAGIAVKTEKRSFTYEELNRYASSIAGLIKKQWPKNEPKQEHDLKSPGNIGLYLEHGVDMIAAILGTLKAGKAYVPLSPDYPKKRISYMVNHSESALVITNSGCEKKAREIAAENNIPFLNIDQTYEPEVIFEEDTDREISGERLAYIMYTSGSTGKPKGVMQNHENVLYYIKNWTQRFSITHQDRMTLFSSFCHDGSGQDMFGALLNGATLYPYDVRNRESEVSLSRFLLEEEITIWHSVPSLYNFFVKTLTGKEHFDSLRYILLGGEPFRGYEIEMFKKHFPQTILANVYGQTESSVDSIWTIAASDTIKRLIIGQPLDNTRIFVIDGEGNEVEPLETGEILIACPHITPGYWRDDETTKKTFGQDPGIGRLYYTGDLGRLLPDGNIEFMGRKDFQVKIRGFRVEIGEVETSLLQMEHMREAAVVPKETESSATYLCAFIAAEKELDVTELREFLSRELPDYMIPTSFVQLDRMPLTQSGKIDRKALSQLDQEPKKLNVTYVAPQTSMERITANTWKEVLHLEEVGINDNFFDLGGNSFDIIKVNNKLRERLKRDIPMVKMFEFPTIGALANYLHQQETKTGSKRPLLRRVQKINKRVPAIAVIGMAGRFPGAKNIDEFWNNIINGLESISFFSTPELEQAGVDPQSLQDPNYVGANGVLADIDYFDAAFFKYSPNEAKMMDPQLRLLHECSWEALENAGYNPDAYDGYIGIYAGNAPNQYWVALTYLNQTPTNALDTIFLNQNYSTKISYKLNLKGPSVIVQTACSTSLVAIHFACQGLINGECDMALAGGVSIALPDRGGYLYQEGMLLSRDGHCRTFAANAGGTIFANGVGMVVLKPLEDALADGDTIDAVIKGSTINNDGNRKVGITAPSVEGEAEVISAAQGVADIEPESIGYIEAHGTGTILGDPVEIEALKLAFDTDKKQYCAIGSVKTNVGHLNSAAGVAGFIKTVLALKHKIIPPSLHFDNPNPGIDFVNSPFYVTTGLKEWKSNHSPRRAGVSSFGLGGTNAHVILEEFSEGTRGLAPLSNRQYQLILLSAKTAPALERMTQNLAEYYKANLLNQGNHENPTNPGPTLADAAYTLQVGRKAFKYRRMSVCSRSEELVDIGLAPVFAAEEGNKPVVFMFAGQGTQYVDMGWDLYRTEPVFRQEMDRCFEILKPLTDYDIKEVLYPFHRSYKSNEFYIPPDITQTEIAQPLLFTFEYALAKLLMEWGIRPTAMIGYSFGEYMAACISGVFSLEDALEIITTRGELMRKTPAGAMLSVPLPEKEIKPLLSNYQDISLSIVNDPSCIVGGSPEAVEAFAKEMKEQRLICGRVNTSHAVHSPLMNPIREEFEKRIGQFTLNPPQIPYLSNVSGDWIADEEAVNPGYWGKHMCSTARFSEGIKKLLTEDKAVFIEIGPGRVLGNLVRQHADNKAGQMVLNLVRHQEEKVPDDHYLLKRIGQLWLYGMDIDGVCFYGKEKRQRIHLPAYPFEKQRFWLEGDPFKIGKEKSIPAAAPGKKPDIADWFYIPIWKPAAIPDQRTGQSKEKLNWLIFTDTGDIGFQLSQELKQQGHEVVIVKPGTGFVNHGHEYTINPGNEEDYHALMGECRAMGKIPRRILHLWNITKSPAGKEVEDAEDAVIMQERGFYSLLSIARAIGKQDLKDEIEITVITNQIQGVSGDDLLYPQKATILGPLQVIPREYFNINCRSIDIENPGPGPGIVEGLLAELFTESRDPVVAIRNNQRWVRTFEAKRLEKPMNKVPRLKDGGVYLFTGGLGGIGLVLAKYLAETVKPRLILTGRSPLPPKQQWADWLLSHDPGDEISIKIEKIRELEALGAEVLIFSADVTNREAMQEVISLSGRQWGKINGVIHAAGAPDGTIIQRRTKEMSQRILAPKVTGTLVLDAILKDTELDFFILCSSTVSVTALGGQVAYCAANIFLDHFARYRSTKENSFTVSINWDAWQQVGMAAKAVKKANAPSVVGKSRELDPPHPLFAKVEMVDPNHHIFISNFSIGKDWVLEEHRILDKATLPGTAYLEMARTAFERHTGNSPIELSDVYFLAPLTMQEGEEKEVRTIIKKQDSGYTFSIISRIHPDKDQWVEHARGKAGGIKEEKPQKYDITELLEKCSGKEVIYDISGKAIKQGTMTFGPRWNNLSRVKLGEKQGVAVLELPGVFSEDIKSYKLHPALLDRATTFLRPRVETQGAYMPFSYKRLRIKGSLPGKIICYARSLNPVHDEPQKETLEFDVKIMDARGIELVDIEAFSLRRVNVEEARAKQILDWGPKEVSHPLSFFLSFSPGKDPIPGHSQQESQPDPLKEAILPAEGVDAFTRILAQEQLYQVLVSTTDLHTRLQQVQKLTEAFHRQHFQDETSSLPKHSRPELSSAYAAPGNETEHILTEIWQELLGIDKVGIHDDFFELGGDSLKAVTFAGKIYKRINIEVPLPEFFDRPTIKKLAQYIAVKNKKPGFHSIEPAEKKEYYVLSSAQKRLYILQAMEAQSIGYNFPSAVLLEGDIESQNLGYAIQQLIKRHEAFRASFEMVNNEPVQRIHDRVDFELEFYDQGEKNIQQFLLPFGLSLPPLIRVGLIREEKKKHLLMVDIHHIVYDGTSMAIFFKELMSLYGGKELLPLRIQYKDFAQWQYRRPVLAEKENQQAYWLNVFSGEIPVINLPLDFARPPIQDFKGSRLKFVLEEKQANSLKNMAKEEGVTLYMLLLAVIDVLLMKLSSQEDIVVGTPLAGRRHPDLEQIIGIFINTLALRSFPTHDKTFREFLAEIKERTLKAFENQDYPFEELVEKVKPRRDASRNPIFDVMFRLHNFEAPGGGIKEMEIRGLKLSAYHFDPHSSIFDLNFGCGESGDKLLFTVDYCTALFKVETIERMITYFRKIVEAVQGKENLAKKLSDIEMISRQEKLRVLYDFNHTKTEYPKDKTIHELFAEQAERTPDYVALVGSCEALRIHENNHNMSHMSYKELNKNSHRLSVKLREKGVKPGAIAAIMVNRTIRMIVGFLGILKAGGTYLPLDPEYPGKRINYILENSNAEVLVTTPQLQVKVEENASQPGLPLQIIHIHTDPTFAPGPSFSTLTSTSTCRVSPANPAYIIYTSGSTGNPKGVVIRHKNAVNFIKGMTSRIDFSPGKTILALTTISFDIFFLETLLPITRGLKVVMADENQQKDPALLEQLILKNQVNMVQFTPSRLQLLLNLRGNLQGLAGVEELMVGGEAFPSLLLEKVKEHFQGKIYNMYGPTETTIWSAVKELTYTLPAEITIGTPIANTRVYIVDRNNHPKPLGVSGELLIGGDGTALGYLNNVELTAEKFDLRRSGVTLFEGTRGLAPLSILAVHSPQPAAALIELEETDKDHMQSCHHASIPSRLHPNTPIPHSPSSPIYRTGDLARWLPTGEIEFLGRLDHQVKIRGFRIELEEIEEQLMDHEGIKEAVVTAKTVNDGDNYLVAYIVPEFPGKEKEFEVSHLRDYLSRQLPPYMIPSYFISLEKIPLTPNGKINRSALPVPDQSRPQLSTTYTEPKTDEEKIVAQLWKGVLNVDNVGIYDNFFDLGGNSMKLIQLSSKLKETIEKDVPVITLFRYPTIDSLLQYLGTGNTVTGMTDGQIDEAVGDLEETMGLLIGTDGE
jgi:polyketide synthase PksJ